MAETKQIVFNFQEIVTALIKKENIHEGIWMIYIEFGLAAINAPVSDSGGELTDPLKYLMPAALLPIKTIGIQRAEQLSNLAVDAAVVNPKTKSTTARKTPKKK
ncbi:MAG: hypothetical protein ABIR33_05310 [Pyrinomonadaceae bacterium]